MLRSSKCVISVSSCSICSRCSQSTLGYDSLFEAVQPLLSDAKTTNETLGFLVAFALHNLALSSLFELTDSTDYPDIDSRIQDMEPLFGTIRYPEAIQTVYACRRRPNGAFASSRRNSRAIRPRNASFWNGLLRMQRGGEEMR